MGMGAAGDAADNPPPDLASLVKGEVQNGTYPVAEMEAKKAIDKWLAKTRKDKQRTFADT